MPRRKTGGEGPEKPAQSAHLKKGHTPRPGSREAEAVARQRKQDTFLTAFAKHATIAAAATAVHVSRRTHYTWLESDEGYAARFKEAEEGECPPTGGFRRASVA